MKSTAPLREFLPDFENVCQIVEYTSRYPDSTNSEIFEKNITGMIQIPSHSLKNYKVGKNRFEDS